MSLFIFIQFEDKHLNPENKLFVRHCSANGNWWYTWCILSLFWSTSFYLSYKDFFRASPHLFQWEKSTLNFRKKVRILKLRNFIFSKYNVMHNWTPLLAHTEPFNISPSPICITETSRRDKGNFFVLSFKSECSYIHKGGRISHLANKYIKSQLLEIFVNYLFTHLHKYREKERWPEDHYSFLQ